MNREFLVLLMAASYIAFLYRMDQRDCEIHDFEKGLCVLKSSLLKFELEKYADKQPGPVDSKLANVSPIKKENKEVPENVPV